VQKLGLTLLEYCDLLRNVTSEWNKWKKVSVYRLLLSRRSFIYLFQHAQIDVKCQFGFEFVGQQAQSGVNVSTALNAAPRPTVIVPAQHSALHSTRHFVVSHISLCAVQQALKLQSIGVAIRYHISDLTDNCGENENANQIADDCENVSEMNGR